MSDPETHLRFGLGFDSHAPAHDRTLKLGGVTFEGESGLAGHSDADVVCHALADAVLGAAGLGDIGGHFPETDPGLAGIDGRDLLRRVVELVRERGMRPVSCDVVVVIERPSIAAHRDEIRSTLAEVLGTRQDRISVKGKRPEGLALTDGGAACIALAVLSP
ncbi:MAG TPA: 2-C-methyl-D-erythritol 2,4-cyclodiphosphate synthase [Actinomycetota bacterium]|nr:2-C-methyl-D-erythritol 2,4-cyclodiphosphate synthase [Actinomycetota bacterium]